MVFATLSTTFLQAGVLSEASWFLLLSRCVLACDVGLAEDGEGGVRSFAEFGAVARLQFTGNSTSGFWSVVQPLGGGERI
ncbi:hypothetical protein BDV96DRAFT_115061 [Lophiotrema nucula]|uniref:Secreted protein n=1 Tax=Lophiotrema nucula TaxID=690887 RepID=A0A6A5Z5K2_9PLEO|nr:hypothetical protein BDV96DRAFT_115061 [Lophiotrema nucula]